MIISKILQKHNEVQIYSDDELLFTCTSNFVTDHRLFVGAEVANIENLQYEATLSLLESKLLGYCSKQLVNRHKANMQLKKYAQKILFYESGPYRLHGCYLEPEGFLPFDGKK